MKLSTLKSCLYSALLGIGILATSTLADAHHSFTMFDSNKLVTLSGTVTKYAFQMPHVWFYMTVTNASGQPEEWGMEMSSPNLATRSGWSVKTLHAGDKVTVSFHPMRDGSKAGSVVSAKLPDGRTLYNGNYKKAPKQ